MTDDPLPDPRGLEISLLNIQTLEVDQGRLEETARSVCLSQQAFGELSIVLVDAQKMTEMNSQYRDECGPTDVLSFSIDGLIDGGPGDGEDPPFIIGELIICPEVAAKQAPDALQDEMVLLVTHGILHLLGFDHETEEEAEVMRSWEMKLIGRSGASAN